MILERDARAQELGGAGESEVFEGGGFGGRLGRRLADRSDLEAAVGEVAGLGDDPGLGLLVDLAKKGEYDPWNVDIVSVTDSYLEALDERLDAADLRRVARLIFYAAALIHLKAKALAAQQADLDYEEALEQAFAEEFGDAAGDGLGAASRLRPGDEPLDYGFLADGGVAGFAPAERPVRERGLTLVDLIVALREYDERLAHKELLEADGPEFTEDMVLEECVGGSHQEDLGQDIREVRAELWERLADGGHATLESLTNERRPRASAYLALLFLSNEEEVLLEQDELYGELRVVRGPYFGEVRAGVVLDEDELDVEDEEEEGREEPFADEAPDEAAACEEEGKALAPSHAMDEEASAACADASGGGEGLTAQGGEA
ncbi:MAG: hypothetical protein D6731_14990 [Planctomycetota bacterium]|nr:MAG: hypothetical protein D6731_14990 [Planctomycetota bacterium]